MLSRGRGRRGAARPPWLRTQTHGGQSDCSTSPGKPRETFPRGLRGFRMLRINSSAALIFRAVMQKEYLMCKKHILILLYFIVEYQ